MAKRINTEMDVKRLCLTADVCNIRTEDKKNR